MNRISYIFLMMVLLISCAISVYGWDLPLEVSVNSISFNFNSSIESYEGINIKVDKNVSISAPEWLAGRQTNYEFAYLKSTSNDGPTVRVEFYCTDEDIDSIEVFPFPCSALWWDMPAENVLFNDEYSEVDFETDQGTLPNEVSVLSVEWAWKVSKVNGITQSPTIAIGVTSHEGYVVLSDPQPPQEEPFACVLKRACGWADGATTESGILSALTTALHTSGVTYDDGGHYTTEHEYPLIYDYEF